MRRRPWRPRPSRRRSPGTVVEEQVAREVGAGGVGGVEVGQQGPSELVDAEQVEAVVADVCRGAEGVEDALHTGPQLLLAGGAAAPVAGVGCPGEVEQVDPLGLVELEGGRHGFQDRLGHAGEVAALQARVVVGADVGEHGDFLAPQPFDPPVAAVERRPAWSGVSRLRREVRKSRTSALLSMSRPYGAAPGPGRVWRYL